MKRATEQEFEQEQEGRGLPSKSLSKSKSEEGETIYSQEYFAVCSVLLLKTVLWSRRESNPRPNKELTSFLHAYSGIDCRIATGAGRTCYYLIPGLFRLRIGTLRSLSQTLRCLIGSDLRKLPRETTGVYNVVNGRNPIGLGSQCVIVFASYWLVDCFNGLTSQHPACLLLYCTCCQNQKRPQRTAAKIINNFRRSWLCLFRKSYFATFAPWQL